MYRTKEAAEYIGMTESTLEAWRCRGGGPDYIAISKRAIRYRKEDLDAFIESRRKTNTSQCVREKVGECSCCGRV